MQDSPIGKDGYSPVIGYYNLSVILTYLGLGTSIVGIVNALEQRPHIALLCLMVCGMCDMFDGTIARHVKRSEEAKSFGIQIDSLCDLVCFGVLPAMIGYSIRPANWFSIFCMIFFVLAAIIRLGYFNVQEIIRVETEGGKRRYYEGLPVTSVALLIPMLFVADLLTRPSILQFYHFGLLVLGCAFLTKFKIRKPYLPGLILCALVGLILFVLLVRLGGNINV